MNTKLTATEAAVLKEIWGASYDVPTDVKAVSLGTLTSTCNQSRALSAAWLRRASCTQRQKSAVAKSSTTSPRSLTASL
jgi:hypothetical protein